jgi:hypothetical protein
VTRPSPSTLLRVPTPEGTNEGKLIYIAALERRLLFYIVRDIKMRAALELATGVRYDEVDFSSMTFEDIQNMVVQDFARGLNISVEDALERVLENKVISNPDES